MLRLGIVGLPTVGKSTLFNALTSAGALVANYPFATIEPNTGVVTVPDPRLDTLADIVKPQKSIPAAVEFLDIAGLVKGASQGEGLGNQFLANIREVDAIVHVIRCFDDPDVQQVENGWADWELKQVKGADEAKKREILRDLVSNAAVDPKRRKRAAKMLDTEAWVRLRPRVQED